jgi:hypothetical protein
MERISLSRRDFIKTSASVGAASFVSGYPSSVLGANERISFGVIGTGSKGTGRRRRCW